MIADIIVEQTGTEWTLISARLSTIVVSIIGLRVMYYIYHTRKSMSLAKAAPVLIFTSCWLFVLFLCSFIPLLLDYKVIASGFLFVALAMGYIWSLLGTIWLLYRALTVYPLLMQRSIAETVQNIQTDLSTDTLSKPEV